jgi:hypothetical protein
MLLIPWLLIGLAILITIAIFIFKHSRVYDEARFNIVFGTVMYSIVALIVSIIISTKTVTQTYDPGQFKVSKLSPAVAYVYVKPLDETFKVSELPLYNELNDSTKIVVETDYNDYGAINDSKLKKY